MILVKSMKFFLSSFFEKMNLETPKGISRFIFSKKEERIERIFVKGLTHDFCQKCEIFSFFIFLQNKP